MSEKFVSKTLFPSELKERQVRVGDISVLVRNAQLSQGLPYGRVYVALPETNEHPSLVISAGVGLAHPASAYLKLNRELQGRGYAPENGVLRAAVSQALEPYVDFVEEQEPEFKKYD